MTQSIEMRNSMYLKAVVHDPVSSALGRGRLLSDRLIIAQVKEALNWVSEKKHADSDN